MTQLSEGYLQPSTNQPKTNKPPFEKRAHRVRDEVFWTELEIRRLSNFVAETIHSKRFIGDSQSAAEERQQMRIYIEAMKRKSMRVLHRAELFKKSGQPSWPGIDPTIGNPVSLAEDYVKVVENYMAVLSSEEERVRNAALCDVAGLAEDGDADAEEDADAGADAGANVDANGSGHYGDDDWEAKDDVAYREALQRERDQKEEKETEQSKRNELMGGIDADGMRRRKGHAESDKQGGESKSSLNKEEEEIMARHQPVQDELTNNLADLVGQLKNSVVDNKERLDKDKKVVDEVEDAVDKNADGVSKQRSGLAKFENSSSTSWWLMIAAVAVILLVFMIVLFLLAVPM